VCLFIVCVYLSHELFVDRHQNRHQRILDSTLWMVHKMDGRSRDCACLSSPRTHCKQHRHGNRHQRILDSGQDWWTLSRMLWCLFPMSISGVYFWCLFPMSISDVYFRCLFLVSFPMSISGVYFRCLFLVSISGVDSALSRMHKDWWTVSRHAASTHSAFTRCVSVGT